MKKIIDLIPQKKRSVSPHRFLTLSKKEKGNIKSCRFVPPAIGSSGFGHFDITVKHPTYSMYNAETK